MMELFIQTWFPVASFVATVMTAVIIYWVRGTIRAETAENFERISGDISDHEKRLTELEAERVALPSKDDLHNLAIRVESLNGALAAINEKISAVSDSVGGLKRSVDHVNEYLLNEK